MEKTNPQSLEGPLAHRMRPLTYENFVGHEEVFTRFPFLKGDQFPSLVFWGPPGVGKTTLAHLLSTQSNKKIFLFNAVTGGIPELKKVILQIQELKEGLFPQESILFLDEIHRFNKTQQDALLPYLEQGAFTLIGATTENPKVALNRALISRLQLIELKKLSPKEVRQVLYPVVEGLGLKFNPEAMEFLSEFSNGDARIGLNILDCLNGSDLQGPIKISDLQPLIENHTRSFDRKGNRHYDIISAFIKSMRGSDPQAAVFWLAKMIDGGEDPLFIARRMVIFASEDIGNADPSALGLATNALLATEKIGMPEARIILSQAATYLASTYKSNSSYLAIDEALSFVRSHPEFEVPAHLKSSELSGAKKGDYLYPHSYPQNFVLQKYVPMELPQFYRPSVNGKEGGLKQRLEGLWKSN